MNSVKAYRQLLRELKKSSPIKLNRALGAQFRPLFEKMRGANEEEARNLEYDAGSVLSFLKAQREYKELLDRYNPLIDLTGEERIEATAKRVGLRMPKLNSS